MIILDSSALIAFLLREPGHETAALHRANSSMSSVNFSEVLTRMSRDEISPRTLAPRLIALGLTIIDFDAAQAVVAAGIGGLAQAHGVGRAECCCFALALHRSAPVLTADRAWTSLGFDIAVHLIRH